MVSCAHPSPLIPSPLTEIPVPHRYTVAALEQTAAEIAVAAGVPASDARILAEALVDAEVQGVSTHGLSRLGIYIRRIQAGLIDPQAALTEVENTAPAVRVFDACNGLGQVQAIKVLDRLAPLARSHGVAVATVRNSQHFGALSYYCNRMAAEGFILLATTNCEPAMAPAGGSQAYFGTNPIAASFPTGQGFPIKVDLATSIVARGNIIAADKQGRSIPPDWALDPNGEATTDPAAALAGTVRTMAGPKGYALALMVEMLSGVLSGANVGANIGSMYKDMDRPQGVGHFFCLLNIAAFGDPEDFKKRTDRMVGEIKQNRRMPGVEEVLVPGERSARVAETNREVGIALADATLNELRELCTTLGVALPTNKNGDPS